MSVGLVIVSHSAKLAEGVVELAAQMAPDVRLVAAGGTGDGGIGTSLDRVTEALNSADGGSGVLVLTDLGSAVMTAETALEFLGHPVNVQLAEAPLVEGAVAAAVTAQSGAALAEVRRAAESAFVTAGDRAADPQAVQPQDSGAPVDQVADDVELVNPLGLHARPAATLAGALGAMDVDITINGVDGQSVMMLMTLAAGKGSTLHLEATGADARKAVDFVRREVVDGFGEL